MTVNTELYLLKDHSTLQEIIEAYFIAIHS